MDGSLSDAMLLAAVGERDLDAMRALYDRHAGWLSVRLARRCNDPDMVADAVPTLGGPLLGIALARWVRFPGTALVAFLFLYGWVSLISILAWAHSDSLPFVMPRFFAPFTFFTLTDGPYNVDTWRGSPWFFVGWQLGLCAVAVTVALLRGADGRRQRRLVQVLVAVAAVTALMYALTVAGGWDHPVVSHLGQAPAPIGHSPHPTNR